MHAYYIKIFDEHSIIDFTSNHTPTPTKPHTSELNKAWISA